MNQRNRKPVTQRARDTWDIMPLFKKDDDRRAKQYGRIITQLENWDLKGITRTDLDDVLTTIREQIGIETAKLTNNDTKLDRTTEEQIHEKLAKLKKDKKLLKDRSAEVTAQEEEEKAEKKANDDLTAKIKLNPIPLYQLIHGAGTITEKQIESDEDKKALAKSEATANWGIDCESLIDRLTRAYTTYKLLSLGKKISREKDAAHAVFINDVHSAINNVYEEYDKKKSPSAKMIPRSEQENNAALLAGTQCILEFLVRKIGIKRDSKGNYIDFDAKFTDFIDHLNNNINDHRYTRQLCLALRSLYLEYRAKLKLDKASPGYDPTLGHSVNQRAFNLLTYIKQPIVVRETKQGAGPPQLNSACNLLISQLKELGKLHARLKNKTQPSPKFTKLIADVKKAMLACLQGDGHENYTGAYEQGMNVVIEAFRDKGAQDGLFFKKPARGEGMVRFFKTRPNSEKTFPRLLARFIYCNRIANNVQIHDQNMGTIETPTLPANFAGVYPKLAAIGFMPRVEVEAKANNRHEPR